PPAHDARDWFAGWDRRLAGPDRRDAGPTDTVTRLCRTTSFPLNGSHLCRYDEAHVHLSPAIRGSMMSAKRNLLLGMLALQNNFIDRTQLLAAFNAWTENRSKPLGVLLVEQKALCAEHHVLLEALTDAHLQRHDDDPDRSLAALSPAGSARHDLEQIGDVELQASLVVLPRSDALPAHPSDGDPYATASFAAPVGTSGRFRILRPFAEGGLGQVSVARDEELNREVALKEIKDRYADDAECRARFLREAAITGQLEHPGVVPVYALGTYGDGRPFYAM